MNHERNLLWFLFWSVLIVALLIGQYQQRINRERESKHRAVNASMIQPSTIYINTR